MAAQHGAWGTAMPRLRFGGSWPTYQPVRPAGDSNGDSLDD